jgi:hypothetical protein
MEGKKGATSWMWGGPGQAPRSAFGLSSHRHLNSTVTFSILPMNFNGYPVMTSTSAPAELHGGTGYVVQAIQPSW